jgi:hypothetical protein
MENEYNVEPINYQDCLPFILDIHYARRVPSISWAFGLFKKGDNPHDLFRIGPLVGIVSFGTPSSPSLCEGICGVEHKENVIELNRLVLRDNLKNEASFLVSRSLKLLPKPKIVVSYADTAQDHAGIIYQATNFLFTGTTRPRTDIAGKDGKHSRHHLGDNTNRINRSAKHRYIYFLGNKREKKELKQALRYQIKDSYPKESIDTQSPITT